MKSLKGFSAYRMALVNSEEQMIPYLGVHLRDLNTINEAKSDMKDGLVNWTKFQQMAKTAAVVVDCERMNPKLGTHREIENLIKNAPVMDEKEQYEHSQKYEPKKQNTQSVSKNPLRAPLRKLVDTISS